MRIFLLATAIAFAGGCSAPGPGSVPVTDIPGHGNLGEDTSPKEGPRLVPPEAYIRTYIQLFGGLAPADVQTMARGNDGSALFDTWNDYLSSLGLPDYRVDIPRLTQTNTLMLATFERLGIVLCDRAVERDMGMTPPAKKIIFDFDPPQGTLDQNGFNTRFDVLHRTFLGYPLELGPKGRAEGFFKLYTDTVVRHQMKGAPASRFKPEQAGWAEVCYGLVRHPEFHLY